MLAAVVVLATPPAFDRLPSGPAGDVAGIVDGAGASPGGDPRTGGPDAGGQSPRIWPSHGLPAAAPPAPSAADPLGEGSPAARHPADPATLTGYRWPLPGARMTQPFGPTKWGSRRVDGAPFHDGIDLATFCGDRVIAAHDGVVLSAGRRYDGWIGWVGDLGPYLARLDEKGLWMTLPIVVVIDDGNDYRSMYAHLRESVVKAGDVVRAGQLIGYEGQTGRASGCHLHYGIFSPYEARTFEIDPGVVERMLLPPREIARIDPLRVLPPLEVGGIR